MKKNRTTQPMIGGHRHVAVSVFIAAASIVMISGIATSAAIASRNAR